MINFLIHINFTLFFRDMIDKSDASLEENFSIGIIFYIKLLQLST